MYRPLTAVLLDMPELRVLVFAYQHGVPSLLRARVDVAGVSTPLSAVWARISQHDTFDRTKYDGEVSGSMWTTLFLPLLHPLDDPSVAIEPFARACRAMFTSHVMDTLASCGAAAALAALYHQHALVCSRRGVKLAATHGHLNVLRFFHDTCVEIEWSVHVLDKAAAAGHLSIVAYVTTVRPGLECTTSAMDLAALGGHLDVVRYLHTHRTEGCTTNAMRNAARAGHLPIVQFLHVHRQEGCTAEALRMAAAAGHADVVMWLVDHRTEGMLLDALEHAARHGHGDVVSFLHMRLTAVGEIRHCDRAVVAAAAHGHLDIVRYFFHQNGSDVPPWMWCRAHVQALMTPRRTNGVVRDVVG
ncbi:Aste57867_662 [Aphanomyces stellatus]|uniref:Aste57867_662 protein n=1 Tax=Aphanomyces stellatus TaxID=120398 RepID=A0A485K468_9STRA|nr:hypothetical protein As57867_000661 [Aphanomyces stellatus]VFT77887.1 Aste57867_662 [Aphanomyces stellatus]